MNAQSAIVLPPELLSYLLISVRMAAMLLLSPPLSSSAIPAMARTACVLGMAAAIWSLQPPLPSPTSIAALVGLVASEFLTGAWMALGMALVFAAFNAGARLLDIQIGFGIGQVLDASTRMRTPVLTATVSLLAPVIFFATDTHHLLLRAAALSVERLPIGTTWPAPLAAEVLLAELRSLFSMALAVVAPIASCLLLVEVALGVLARSLPQMNVFVVGAPVKVVVGLAALAAWIGLFAVPMQRGFLNTFRGWEALLR